MPNPVSLNDAVKAVVGYRLNNLHMAMPAAIISYDYNVQKASVQPLLNKVWTDGTITPYPILENIPVVFPRAGGGGITFPVIEGDTCLLLFIERSIDLWKTIGGQVSPNDSRKFDLSDAVAIMGLFPFNQTSTADNNTDMLLTYANSKIRIKQNGDIVIESASNIAIGTSTTELLNIVSQLMGLLTGAVVMGLAFEGPLDAAFITQVTLLKAKLDAITGTIP